ncbi:autotransporter outer membrane beta-barrel domain-containing protein, partial [Succiniclasticum ruminis]|uniref:autotransporter outer membrane beta-barrel domain-containing protein n=1 Tax=Succiniclasticum ruminis TaxID=40841 RepID=UPI0015A565E0
MKRNLFSKNKLTALTAAVLLGLYGTSATVAAEAAPVIVSGGGRDVFEVRYLTITDKNKEAAGVLFWDFANPDAKKAKPYNHPSQTQDGILKGVQYWADILGAKTRNALPARIFVRGRAQHQNADAASVSVDRGEPSLAQYWRTSLQQGKEVDRIDDFTRLKIVGSDDDESIIYKGKKLDNAAYAIITAGQFMGAKRSGAADGWWTKSGNVLADNEQAANLTATMRHEMAHALGFTSQTIAVLDASGEEMEDKDGLPLLKFPDSLTEPNAWIYHLRDQNLNPAAKEKLIISSREFARRKKKDASLSEADFFIIDKKKTDVPRSTKAYFVGDKVSEVLDGKRFDGVDGLPVTGWEGSNLDLAHLETGGLMSHADYRNYTVFTEVELAAMQDIGYQFDRKAYYGRSVYNDGLTLTNTRGYSARNAAGTAYIAGKYSEVPYGIGLHVFGSRNNVTQAADILTKGFGAAGIRIDGSENTVTLARKYKVHADGTNGIGALISYGRNQTLNQEGTITADGKGGNGVQFDFGSNMLGADNEYRGSFIRFTRDVDAKDGSITSSVNNRIDKTVPELDGPMVKEYNLAGTLSGAKNAIYIGRNAFVENINVKDGASIRGNITSDWRYFNTDGSYDEVPGEESSQPLCLQYNGSYYTYDSYIPELATNLNFAATLTYNGNIYGPDNMKLNVAGGTLTYGGKADVVGVRVAENASLLGGSYKVHDMTMYTPSDVVSRLGDIDKGNFINNGTVGAASADTAMNITGNLLSDGILQGVAGGSAGTVRVSGDASIDGSQVIAKNLLPDEKFTVLQAGSVSGSVTNTEDSPYKFGMLDETGAVEGNTAVVTGKAANNLGKTDAVQAETYDAMMSMYNNLTAKGDARRNEMRPLFTLTPGETKKAFSAISSNASPKSMALAQRSVMTRHLLSSRLNEAFIPEPVKVKLPEAKLDGGSGGGPEVSLKLLEP